MFKRILFQLHWFFGITAGLILAIMGVTGAIYSYDDQIIRLINSKSFIVAEQTQPLLTPDQIYQKINAQFPDKKISAITVAQSKTEAASVNISVPNNRRGENIKINPYTAQQLPKVQGEKFFQFIQDLHRRLTMGEFGKQLTGASTLILIYFVLSGLYLRWPKKNSWREWFAVKWTLSGRSFLWSLHAIVGTWVLLFYLLLSLTGLYWSYDWYRDAMFKVMQVERPQQQGGGEAPPRPAANPGEQRQQTPRMGSDQRPEGAMNMQNDQATALAAGGERENTGKGDAEGKEGKSKTNIPAALGQTWIAFSGQVNSYSTASIKVPNKGSTVEVSFFDAEQQHDRARNTFKYDVKTQEVKELSFYRDKKLNEKIMSSMLPVHRGNFFGPVWQFLTMLAALAMPLFFVTGWMLYLKRRKQKKLTKAAQGTLAVNNSPDQKPWLIVYASQTGFAEQIAWRTAHSLQHANIPAQVLAIDKLKPADLAQAETALFVSSTYGQGEPPDHARLFAKKQLGQPLKLEHLQYAVLALGDREYKESYCGFAHQINQWLNDSNAAPLFDVIEVNNANSDDLERWNQALAHVTQTTLESVIFEKIFDPWTLNKRELLNADSVGEPAFNLQLSAAYDTTWNAGDIAEIQCGNSNQRIHAFLEKHQLDFATSVTVQDQTLSAFEALRYLNLTQNTEISHAATAQEWVDALPKLASREYSIASIPQDGYLGLVVRQSQTENGLGLGSGWLTAHTQTQQSILLRIRSNESFHAPDDNRPVILIGNGTGIAGLLSILKHREQHGFRRNWLIFGERNRQQDFFFKEQIKTWLADKHLSRVDLAFSRDQEERVYVQHRIAEQAELIRQWVGEGASIYVCGSIEGMAPAVDQALTDILGEAAMEQLSTDQRYRRDVY